MKKKTLTTKRITTILLIVLFWTLPLPVAQANSRTAWQKNQTLAMKVTEEMTPEHTPTPSPKPRTDTDLEPHQLITAKAPEQEFFIFQTKNERTFYLIIDRSKMSENVYLVTEVDEEDLLSFVKTPPGRLLAPVSPIPTQQSTTVTPVIESHQTEALPKPKLSIPLGSGTIITALIILILGAGFLLYWKVFRVRHNKVNEADFFEDDYLEDSPIDINDDEDPIASSQ